MVEKKAKRDRGRILSEAGWQKLDEALQQWEVQTDQRRTFEKLAAAATLDPGTVAKIFKRKEGADLGKIEQLFRAFRLQVEAIDHCPVPQGMAQNADPNFVGRAGAIADLNALVERGAKVIVIQARGGVGKTTLARKYLQQEFGSFLEFPIAKETKDIASIESLIEEKLKQLGEEPGREFLVSIDRLKRKLQSEAIGILIDNLEPALDSSGKFIEPHRRYVELLRVLSDPSVQSIALITSRERLYEPSVTVQHYLLNSLDVAAWEQFFQLRQLLPDAASLAALHRAYGGNAKAMEIISSAIQTDYSGDVAAYWQANQDDLLIERALEDLVTQQFDRLQQLDLDAYNLLCRMGCYRYQDVPTVPIEGLLCLLWDVSGNRHRRVIKVLQDLSLVEFENGEYWLHPVIRSEAIGRLIGNRDRDLANRAAAQFWIKSVETVEVLKDALRAFEAYHHYIDINDFIQAANVVQTQRPNRWERGEHLGRSFYRLGLPKTMIIAVEQIINNIDIGYLLGKTYYLLSGLYRLSGNPKKSIEYVRQLEKIAIEINHQELKMLALQNMGLAQMELLEIEDALRLFEEGLLLAEKIMPTRTVTFWFCLALLNSCFCHEEAKQKAFNFAQKAHKELAESNYLSHWRKGYGFSCLGMTYKNLGQFDKAFEMYHRAILFAEESYYTQAKAKAICGLAELYQSQGDSRQALLKYLESIELLKKIDNKFDLGEVYYQLGLSYRAIDEITKSNESFQEAIRIFIEMEAPKQVDRVRRSMQSNL
jgi:tetratricopeptide (TPR) repeat protein